ncbi:MAG: amino acid carrier protein [Acidobacteriota bacterium]
MQNILDSLLRITEWTQSVMWGPWMITLLVLTGVMYTVITRGVQVRRLIEALRLTFSPADRKAAADQPGDISPFAALMTALAATVGNGNLAGVATAIATGGPGAPFWMWVTGFIGMATKYGEGFLGVRFRRILPNGSAAGGPMYYCRDGIRFLSIAKILGATFAFCGGLTALIGTGNMAQSNSMALAFKDQFGIPFWASALILVVLTGMVIIGGIKRIGPVAEKLVPAMIIFYLLGAGIILIARFSLIPDAFLLIFRSAFSARAAGGALIGTSIQQAIRMGVARGVLSNESGLGSAAIAQAASKSNDPTRNGLIAMTGTFIDTIVVNTLTTLSIVLTGFWAFTDASQGAMDLRAISPEETAVYALPGPGGLILAQLAEDSHLVQRGLRKGDVLYALEGQPIQDEGDLRTRLLALPTHQTFELTVYRDGTAFSLTGKSFRTATADLPIMPRMTSTALTANAFSSVIPYGGFIIALSSFLFGYSTLLGWSYYGERCWEYIFGLKVILPYRYIFLVLLASGALIQGAHLNIVWYLGDSFNALMAVPNLLGMWFLSGYVGRFTTAYFRDRHGTLAALSRGTDPFLKRKGAGGK